jgi:uncharacterized SAM-binding protein YcdF (DUF218 family)
MIFLGAILVLFGSRLLWLPWLGAWLDVGAAPIPTDYVLVLNGDMNTRPFVAAALVKQGYAKQVIITQVKVSPQWEKSPWPPEHEVVRQIQLKRGVTPDQIVVLESSCDATRDEALVLHKFLQLQPAASVTIVTSNYHTRRTRWVFQEVFGAQSKQLHFVSAPTDYYNASNWWRTEESFVLYLQEYMKFAFYWLYHGRGAWYCMSAVVLMLGIYIVRKRWKYNNIKCNTASTLSTATQHTTGATRPSTTSALLT